MIPRIGVGVLIFKDASVLLGKRKGSHGATMWAPPGGHLEFCETVEACAERETLEETGIQITHIKKGPYTNDLFDEGKHYITLFMVAEYQSGIPETLEPEKCEGWNWFNWNELPSPLFLPVVNLLKMDFQPTSVLI